MCGFTPRSGTQTPSDDVISRQDRERIKHIEKNFGCTYYGNAHSTFGSSDPVLYWEFMLLNEAFEYGGIAFAVSSETCSDEEVRMSITSAIAASQLYEEEQDRHATPTPTPDRAPKGT